MQANSSIIILLWKSTIARISISIISTFFQSDPQKNSIFATSFFFFQQILDLNILFLGNPQVSMHTTRNWWKFQFDKFCQSSKQKESSLSHHSLNSINKWWYNTLYHFLWPPSYSQEPQLLILLIWLVTIYIDINIFKFIMIHSKTTFRNKSLAKKYKT